ncbi:zinc finger protein 771-like [Dunckerocampus dactyliophorus]|uniref:zinc finger protein 771-like n=1 Tax=Dunckerocampus dactyliophorus TaxID=161453 RepID=UPI002406C558|nr:zinc finger protein 771-like [Dunckerocampus dactyliophorus]
MLKELVKERLMAAADEILALFEGTIASYEEELFRTREENERHRRHLEAASKNQIVLQPKDVQQLISGQNEGQPQGGSSTSKQEEPQRPHVKEEEEQLWTTREGECLRRTQEADLTTFPLTVVSVMIQDHEDKPPESSHWFCPSDVQQPIGRQEKGLPQPQAPQSPCVKEEEEELWITQEGECLLVSDEADLTKSPLTVVTLKIEDREDKPPESSQLHHKPSEEDRGAELPNYMTAEIDGDHRGGPRADKLFAPLSDGDDVTSHSPEDEDGDGTREALSSDTDCEGDMRTRADDKHSECSKRKTGDKRFICPVCAKSFSVKSDFSRHMRTHTGEKPFSCSVCGDKFALRSTLKRHMTTHTGEKSFSCSVCGDKFALGSTLKRHMTTHTGEKPFSCSVCGDKFAQSSTLKTHMTTHTGEKPFRCSVCGERFSRKPYFMRHMRTHTGDKPFSCSVCEKRFSEKSNMVSHMRTHTGEKPFSCSICGDTFSWKSSLNSHLQSH